MSEQPSTTPLAVRDATRGQPLRRQTGVAGLLTALVVGVAWLPGAPLHAHVRAYVGRQVLAQAGRALPTSPLASGGTEPASSPTTFTPPSEQFLRTASPEAIYNQGVAAFRAGELEAAADLFRRAGAAGKETTAASAMYNRGTTRYREAMQALAASPAEGEPAANGAERAIPLLEQAIQDLKDAARADPANSDARANAELAHRVLKELKKEQQKQDQQQQQKQDQQQQQDQQQEQQQPSGEQAKNPQPMTKQEVERLLQRIRDRERQRMLEKLERQRSRVTPAPKDW